MPSSSPPFARGASRTPAWTKCFPATGCCIDWRGNWAELAVDAKASAAHTWMARVVTKNKSFSLKRIGDMKTVLTATLVAASLLGSAHAYAQSSVTLYG